MTAEKAYHLSVSDHYFRLTTEGIRLLSNKHHSYYSLPMVIDERAERASDLADSYDAEDMRNHLRIISSEGEVGIEFTILETSASTIEAAARSLGEALGQTVLYQMQCRCFFLTLSLSEMLRRFLRSLDFPPPRPKVTGFR